MVLYKDINVLINGFGPQLLLLELMLETGQNTRSEIAPVAVNSSHIELLSFYNNMTTNQKQFKTEMTMFVTAETQK